MTPDNKTKSAGVSAPNSKMQSPGQNDARRITSSNSESGNALYVLVSRSNRKRTLPEVMSELINALNQSPPREPKGHSDIHDVMSHQYWDIPTKQAAVRKLCEYSFSPSRNYNNETPLRLGIRLGDPTIIATLLQAGANPDDRDARGYDSIAYSILNGRHDLLPVLLQFSATSSPASNGDSALMLAIEQFKNEVPSKREGAFKNFYQTVHILSQFGHVKGVPLLSLNTNEGSELARVMKSLPSDAQGAMSLMITRLRSVQSYSKDELQILARRAPLNMAPFTNPGGVPGREVPSFFKTFSLAGIWQGVDDSLSKSLRKSLMNHKSDDDYTQKRNTDLINIAIREKITLDLDVPSAEIPNNTVLQHAVSISSPGMLEYCIKEQCNLHCVNSNGDYPLHIAANLDDKKKVFELLIQMIGVIEQGSGSGSRKSLYAGCGIADMRALNAKNETFLDIVTQKHPEWVADLVVHLNIEAPGKSLPLPNLPSFDISDFIIQTVSPNQPLNISSVVGTLTEAQPQLKIIDSGYVIPRVPRASETDSDQEITARLAQVGRNINDLVSLLQIHDLSDARSELLTSSLETHLEVLSAKDKMLIILGALSNTNLASGTPSLQDTVHYRVAAITAKNLCNYMKICSPYQRREIVNAYDRSIAKSPDISYFDISHLPAGLNILGELPQESLRDLTDQIERVRAENSLPLPGFPGADKIDPSTKN
jgi:ankyrin repeat protein